MKTSIILTLLPVALGANAACVTDPPEMGDIGPGSGLVCQELIDVSEIERRRLFEPSPGELRAEAAGRVYIYEGLRDTDVERALEEEFKRVQNMMFIRVKPTDAGGNPVKDPKTGAEYVQDDGC